LEWGLVFVPEIFPDARLVIELVRRCPIYSNRYRRKMLIRDADFSSGVALGAEIVVVMGRRLLVGPQSNSSKLTLDARLVFSTAPSNPEVHFFLTSFISLHIEYDPSLLQPLCVQCKHAVIILVRALVCCI
jgi:hypothetical protein